MACASVETEGNLSEIEEEEEELSGSSEEETLYLLLLQHKALHRLCCFEAFILGHEDNALKGKFV